ncbi:IclR helix-turn-helix domain protein [Petrimonas sp. IBARAKI]|nr:IclR helix-turn-helix domain protein [Petrimonas sp. IBARAKI]
MIQVINRALNILELVSKERDRDFSLGEIANSLNLNASTCANIIKTLVNRGYLEQKGIKQGYKLGVQAYYLTGNFSNRKELLKASVIPLQELRDILNESCILTIMKENMRVTLHKELSSQELQVVSSGEEKNIYLTATGRIVLACQNINTQFDFIKKYGLPGSMWPEVINEKDLIDELDKIKRKQLAIHFDGAFIVGVGAPIYKNGAVVAAIGVYLPEVRFNYKMQERIFVEISRTAQLISEKMEEIH